MWIDRFIKTSLLFLLLFTPLAFGAVHAWAFSLVEGIIALMVMAWALRIWRGRKLSGDASNLRVWPYAVPLGLFIGFVALQLVPLPPAVLQTLSPATYEVYENSLPGWPAKTPYAGLLAIAVEEKQKEEETVSSLPAPVGVQNGGAGDKETGRRTGQPTRTKAQGRTPNPEPPSRLPLSLAPVLTQQDLLKFASYALLFFLVLFYPAPGALRDPNHRTEYEIEFMRPLLVVILISAFLVAMLGFLNLFTWNGRVLWFFVPHDASGGGGGVRAAAPFIAPPSFANYLAMTLPLMMMATFSKTFLTPERASGGFRVVCGFASFVMFCGVLLSLSRAGWASAALGAGVFVILMILARGGQSWIARTPLRRLTTFAFAGFCLFLVVALAFVGPRGQERLDLRLQETATETASLYGRYAVWQDSLDMVRDFPVLGVGLGAWPDLFPRYQDPRLDGFYREVHNDYLELLTETGAAGTILLLCFFVVCLSHILRRVFSLDPKTLPVVAALLGGTFAMAFHEIFDFNLQIPANAILFTIFLALALRLSFLPVTSGPPSLGPQAANPDSRTPDSGHRSPVRRPFPALVGSLVLATLALGLFVTAFSQPMATYPYYIRQRTYLSDALAAVYAHPANAEAHSRLFDAVRGKKDTTWQLRALETILWLAPGKTAIRDAYASRLLLQGRKEEAWYEVTRSVADAPSVDQHFYLSRSVAPTLFPREQEAIIFGFRKGIEDGHPAALEGLAEFYQRTGRYSDRAGLYEESAAAAGDPNEKADYLVRAADAAINDRDLAWAEDLLLQATRLQPDDTALFSKLVYQVYLPRKDLIAAEKAVAEGIRNGADALTLRVSLAEAARSAGENEIAEAMLAKALVNGANGTRQPRDRYRSYVQLARVAGSIGSDAVQAQALEKAMELQPNAYEALMEVGAMHESRRDHNRAAFYYRKATRANRTSADAFARLASIEERRFRFAEADDAYASAVRLAPENEGLRSRYEAFKERLAKGSDGDQAIGNRQ